MKEQINKHKFDLPMSKCLTHKQKFHIEYGEHFIPYLKILEKEIGREKVIETLKTLALEESQRYADHVKARGINDLSIFRQTYNPDVPEYQ